MQIFRTFLTSNWLTFSLEISPVANKSPITNTRYMTRRNKVNSFYFWVFISASHLLSRHQPQVACGSLWLAGFYTFQNYPGLAWVYDRQRPCLRYCSTVQVFISISYCVWNMVLLSDTYCIHTRFNLQSTCSSQEELVSSSFPISYHDSRFSASSINVWWSINEWITGRKTNRVL